MARIGTPLHEEELQKVVAEYEEKGCKVVKLNGLCPDAIILTPNGKLIALEVLGMIYNKKALAYHKSWSHTRKQEQYGKLAFDGLEIRTFRYPKDRNRGRQPACLKSGADE